MALNGLFIAAINCGRVQLQRNGRRKLAAAPPSTVSFYELVGKAQKGRSIWPSRGTIGGASPVNHRSTRKTILPVTR
jgi:hypothetical protein